MNIRRLNIVLHRDIGYFFSGLVIIYCISGVALNHVDDWNPDFIIHKLSVDVPAHLSKNVLSDAELKELNALVGESSHKLYDFPTENQLKIYYDNATLFIDFRDRTGVYEKLSRRPLIFESNVIHRNSVKGWKWASDIFAVMLILINITGLFILKGKNGLGGRGKWFIAAGMIPPVVAIVVFELIQR